MRRKDSSVVMEKSEQIYLQGYNKALDDIEALLNNQP
jgi:hypothetical protein